MAYVILARKYRPQVLDEIVGQEHIVQTLKNAIKAGRIAQSFLFVGSRGVGKTSTARIVAKILNCLKRKPNDLEPCNSCDACREITQGTSLDVLEIDGASNRGIDEIRNLRENVKFKPTYGAYKVYIIDEVHMLTQEAFNALLKTLEEPPTHVKFIFATTEPHRVLPTIVSRCQRFDFRRIPSKAIAETLRTVAKKEKIAIETEAIFAIAKAAEGSLRDGESILDQLASYAQDKITMEATEHMLGFTKEETYFTLVDAIYEKKAETVLSILQHIISEGKDLRQFNKGLLEFLRDLLMIRITKKPEIFIDRMKESIAEFSKRNMYFSVDELLYMITIVQNLFNRIRYSTFPQIYTEIALMKMVNRTDMASIDELLNTVQMLERTVEPSDSVPVSFGMRKAIKGAETKNTTTATPKPTTYKPQSSRFVKNQNERQGAQMSAVASVATEAPDVLPLAKIEEVWSEILSAVRKKRMSIGVFLAEAEPVEIEGDAVILGFPNEFNFHKETLDARENKELVEDVIKNITGVTLHVNYVVTEREAMEEIVQPQEEVDHHSKIVESALSIFQGKTIRP